jgi:carnitine monooxygenase subunit
VSTISPRSRGTTLPWEWYLSPDVLRRERELVFAGAWHYAGPLEWVSEPGERFACLAGAAPVVAVRDRDETLRACLRVYRSAPRPALVDTWGPFVFVNADLGAAPLAEALGILPQLIDPTALVFRERAELELAANWKVAVENYLECYHCPVAHKGFSALVDVDPDAYRLEVANGLLSQFGERRGDGDGDRACQFHLVWPALKVIVYPGTANLSIGPVWPTAPERTAGFLDYFFGADVPEQTMRELIEFDDEVGREDRELVDSVQRGLGSGMIEHGRLLLDSERLIEAFQERLAAVLSESL